MTIAQQFTAGETVCAACFAESPVGTTEMGHLRFDRPSGTEWESTYTLVPSDKSRGYCQPTLRVEILAASAAFKP